MDRKHCLVLRITVALGLTCAAASPVVAGQLFSVQTPSGNGTAPCLDPYPVCGFAGMPGTDTAINAVGRLTDFVDFGQTGPIPAGVNLFVHIGTGQAPETVTVVFSIDGLEGGVGWRQAFSALLHSGDTAEFRTYVGATLGAQTALLATQVLTSDGHATLSGDIRFRLWPLCAHASTYSALTTWGGSGRLQSPAGRRQRLLLRNIFRDIVARAYSPLPVGRRIASVRRHGDPRSCNPARALLTL